MCVLFSSRTRTEGVTSLNKILSSKIVSEALMGRYVLTTSDIVSIMCITVSGKRRYWSTSQRR